MDSDLQYQMQGSSPERLMLGSVYRVWLLGGVGGLGKSRFRVWLLHRPDCGGVANGWEVKDPSQ